MKQSQNRIIAWEELAKHNSADDLWIAVYGRAYDVTQWSKLHPGGQLVLVFMAGKDASHQFKAYHPLSAYKLLKGWEIGEMQQSGSVRCQVDAEFAILAQRVEAAGLMKTSLWPYITNSVFLVLLLAATVTLALRGHLIPSALCLALFWQQAAFIGHDLGHSAVTESAQSHAALGLAINSVLGIGMSWWKSTHNVHHIVVNAADSDPDIQFMPLLASSEHFFEPVWSRYHQDQLDFDSWARRLIPWQHLTFFPLLMIARYGLYLQTLKQLLHGKAFIHRPSEIAAQIVFFAWYALLVSVFPTAGQRMAFVLLSHAAFFVLHLQICLSHFACQTTKSMAETSSSWIVHQVEGTMNWSCPVWLDWFHGGLQFQIEHHLFPRMPRHNLRAASKLVKDTCHSCDLKYHCPTFLQAIVETVQVLHSAAKAASQRATSAASDLVPLTSRPQHAVLSRLFI